MKKSIFISKNHKDTQKIARGFLDKLKIGKSATVVGLYGELGAGKTAFTQAISKLLGVRSKVASPTFVIMKRYSLKNSKHNFLFHIDAYRLKNEKELLHLGWEEIIKDRNNLIFIEWPENVRKAMPKHYKIIITQHKNGRKFKIS